jgi:bacterioferritin (cytochrome b1)
MPKCVSYCNELSKNECDTKPKCSYVNGDKRKFCRLSSKYRMDENKKCKIIRKFTKKEAAEHIQHAYRNRTKKLRKTQIRRSSSSSYKTPKSTPPRKITPKKLVENKSLGEQLTKFIKNRQRANYLNFVCSDAGVCIAFGKENETIKEHFNGFVNFNYITSCKRIGQASSNGFVNMLTYENKGYTAYAVLKSSADTYSDNLYYEYLVGQFTNYLSRFFPCFIETYGAFKYTDENAWTAIKNQQTASESTLKNSLIEIKTNTEGDLITNLGESCKNSKHMAILVQYINDAKTLYDKLESNTESTEFINNELLYILFQVYLPLACAKNIFTHYDLHTANVLLYEPIKNGYITYHYETSRGLIVFHSRYIVKIIDYGRSFYDKRQDQTEKGSSLKLYNKICKIKSCDPNCGKNYGYAYLNNKLPTQTTINPPTYHIYSTLRNASHDLRLLAMIKHYASKMADADFKNMIKKVVFTEHYGTPELIINGFPQKINNVDDAFNSLSDLILEQSNIDLNNNVYSTLTKIGDMYIARAGSGNMLRFVPV